MLDALLSVCLGALFAAGLALLSGADPFEAGSAALLIGVLGGGMIDDMRQRAHATRQGET
jgi:hypothetical protein